MINEPDDNFFAGAHGHDYIYPVCTRDVTMFNMPRTTTSQCCYIDVNVTTEGSAPHPTCE